MTAMTDSEALAVLDDAISDATEDQNPIVEALQQARAHIAEALRDAARYRKARELATGFHGTGFSEIAVTLDWPSGTYHRTGDYFDAAIDAAMKDDHA